VAADPARFTWFQQPITTDSSKGLGPSFRFRSSCIATCHLTNAATDSLLLQQQLGARLIAAFGLVGVVLAMTGVYAVLAFGVAQRMREFGVRLALGASGADISRLVLLHGLALVAVGLVIGLADAIGAGRVVSRFLYGIGAVDSATLVAVPVLVVLVAVGASLVPARRGAAADPMTSLRAEWLASRWRRLVLCGVRLQRSHDGRWFIDFVSRVA
jgi:ABC-type antimicrobial peptide transport system permease subunit